MEEQGSGAANVARETGMPEAPREPGSTSARKKAVFWMAVALVALLAVAGLMGGLYAWRFLKAARSLTVGEVDPSRLADGIYSGSYSLFHVKASVEVTVKAGRIEAIELVDAGRMAEETQEDIRDIFERVVSAQSLDVDLESGASVSKMVSLKAVENALSSRE